MIFQKHLQDELKIQVETQLHPFLSLVLLQAELYHSPIDQYIKYSGNNNRQNIKLIIKY